MFILKASKENMFFWIVILPLVLYAGIFVYKTKTGSPYIPSNVFQIDRLLKYIKTGDEVLDMGCGDGRVLIAAADAGAKRAEGWEIEPALWFSAWLKVKKRGLSGKVQVRFGDMWRADFGKFDVVFVYQLEQFSKRFVKKCKKEMRQGGLVVANTYPLEGLTLYKTDGPLLIYRI